MVNVLIILIASNHATEVNFFDLLSFISSCSEKKIIPCTKVRTKTKTKLRK